MQDMLSNGCQWLETPSLQQFYVVKGEHKLLPADHAATLSYKSETPLTITGKYLSRIPVLKS